jgi:hypothetical protein
MEIFKVRDLKCGLDGTQCCMGQLVPLPQGILVYSTSFCLALKIKIHYIEFLLVCVFMCMDFVLSL